MKSDVMNIDKFTKELSKFPKEVILNTVYSELFFRHDDFIKKVKWNDMQDRFDKLMAESENIRKQMKPLIGKKDISSFTQYIKLMDKDMAIQNKVDAVMEEMDKHIDLKKEGE